MTRFTRGVTLLTLLIIEIPLYSHELTALFVVLFFSSVKVLGVSCMGIAYSDKETLMSTLTTYTHRVLTVLFYQCLHS